LFVTVELQSRESGPVVGLLTEHELRRALKMFDQLHGKLGVRQEAGTDLKELEDEVSPEDVLEEIKIAEQRISDRRRQGSQGR
jgi:hypothetical protein